MQGNPEVLDTLNKLLAGELAARDQYFIHAAMYEDWGLTALEAHTLHEMAEEVEHARAFIKRILMLGGTPRMEPEALNIGADVKDMLQKDLALEYQVRDNLKAAIALCEERQDYVTRDLLQLQLQDTEEDHAYWLERQLGLIEKVGLQNYLQKQMG